MELEALMPGPSISADVLERLTAAITSPRVQSREDVLRVIATVLVEAGAARVRLYELGRETIPGLTPDPRLFLTWQQSGTGEQEPQNLGFDLRLSDSSLAKANPQTDLERSGGVLAPAQDSWTKNVDPVVQALGLLGRSWAEVPLYDHGALIGVLAFDWHGHLREWTTLEKTVLSLLGQFAGAQIQAAAPRVESALRNELREIYLGSFERGLKEETAFLKAACRAFQETVRVSSVSIFRYEWSRQALVREDISTLPKGADPSRRTRRSLAHETFLIQRDMKLTVEAWKHEEYRRVLNFQELADRRSDLISPASMDFHDVEIGPVRSAMYGLVGGRDKRYLLRMLNHHDHPGLPFLSQFEMLKRFARDISPMIDSEAADLRSEYLRRLQQALNRREARAELFDSAKEALATVERVGPVIVVGQRQGGKPHVVAGISDSQKSAARDILWGNASFRDASSSSRQVTLRSHSLGDLRGLGLTRSDAPDLAVFPFDSGETRATLLFPVARGVLQRASRYVSGSAYTFLRQVGTVMAQSMEQDYIESQRQGALQALALVGHEMASPLAAMSQLGQRAITLAERREANAGKSSKQSLAEMRERLRYQGETLEAAIRLGYTVGRQSEGTIVGVFQPNQLSALLNRAIYRTRDEMRRALLLQPRGGVVILRPSGDRDVELCCDGPLIEVALLNLYRNAVKYSVERTALATVETRVERWREASHRYVGITVTNWGIPIPDFHEELIFDAFTRYARPIQEVTRRGMGLGLYLARSIARAHGGNASLRLHERDGSSGKPDEQPVYKTAFQISLRSDLPKGPYQERIGERREE